MKSPSSTNTIVTRFLTSDHVYTGHQGDFKSKEADFHLVPIQKNKLCSVSSPISESKVYSC